MKRPAFITVPEHVRAVAFGSTVVVVNYRNGRVETLIGPAARWWMQATEQGRANVPGVLVDEDETALCRQLLAAGLVERAPQQRKGERTDEGPAWVPSWGTQEMAAGYATPDRVPLGVLVRAGLALAVVLGVLAAGRNHKRMARLVRLLTAISGRTTRQAPAELISQAVHAVRRAGVIAPGRVACLEESAAVVVLLAASRRWVTWRHGVVADPIRLHAWVEDEHGNPVAEPSSTATRCAVLRTIPV